VKETLRAGAASSLNRLGGQHQNFPLPRALNQGERARTTFDATFKAGLEMA